jgi:hypothetical protein
MYGVKLAKWWFVLLLVLLVGWGWMSKSSSQLRCVISSVDGQEYCVRHGRHVYQSADLLAEVVSRCSLLIKGLMDKYPKNEGVKRLDNQFDPTSVSETLPTDVHVAYSDNKGEKLGFCLHKTRSSSSRMIDVDTLFFVALHELSHIMTVEEGHPQIFWENFKFLLQQAEEMGLYHPHNYKRRPVEYCGMKLTDNPYYDL